MAFRGKASAVMHLDPDIIVIPECESPENLQRSSIHWPTLFSEQRLRLDANHCAWVGRNPNKGLGVFALREYSLRPLPCDLSKGPIWCLPVHVLRNETAAFDLMAVWSFYGSDARNRDKNPIVHGLEDFAHFFNAKHLVVAGDFNSPVNFAEKGPGGFQATNRELEARGLVNAYHAFSGEPLGQASRATFYYRHDKTKPFHLDHVYVPRQWTRDIKVTSGEYDVWVTQNHSDHVPVIVDISEDVLT